MGKLNLKYLRILLTVYVAFGIVVGLILYYFIPGHYFNWYPVIPSYYSIIAVILYRSLNYFRRKNPAKMINAYMMMRGIKLFLTVLSVLLYNLYIDEKNDEFTIIISAFYFFYLVLETYFYFKFELSIKNDKRG
ncbi:MAG: hypothetical protein VB022_07455 [Rikenellaceae bacterium]|nr:hypothetical protein [Rikenellaceae bacterium]